MQAKYGMASGKYYSADATGSDQTVYTGQGIIGAVLVSADTVTVKDGDNQVAVVAAPGAILNVAVQTSIVVNGTSGDTISVMYN